VISVPARGLVLAASALFAIAAIAASIGCSREAPPEEASVQSAVAPPQAPPSAVPVDHLAPGELVEGLDKAFGLPLPREVQVEWKHPGSVRAMGPVSAHALVKYFRTRISEGQRSEGDTFAEFDDVRLGGNPGHVFRIRMTEVPSRGTLLEIDDVTPPPAEDLPNEEARWRAVGLTPQGKLLDPTHQ
jgi:hypothetical protein